MAVVPCLVGALLVLVAVSLPTAHFLFVHLVFILVRWKLLATPPSRLVEAWRFHSFGIVTSYDSPTSLNDHQANDHLHSGHERDLATKDFSLSTGCFSVTRESWSIENCAAGEWQALQNTVIFPVDKECENITFHGPPRQRRGALALRTRPHIPTQSHSSKLHTHGRSQSAEVNSLHGRRVPVARRGATVPAVTPSQASFWPPRFTTRLSPLEATLYQGSSNLQTEVLSFLVIGCGHEDPVDPIEDPKRDAEYLRGVVGDSDTVLFDSILGKDATLANIRNRVVSLWIRAPLGTHLLLLLTGHGINNVMELSNDERVDESYINGILERLPPKDLDVTVIFDICRKNPNKVAARMNGSVSLVWSCSPGQWAGGLKFGSFPMPSSFFLTGVFMASYDTSQYPDNTFEHHLRIRVSQLAKFSSYLDHWKGCASCLPKQPCPKAFRQRAEFMQDIDLEQAPDALNKLHRLVVQHPRFAELSGKVTNFMMHNRQFLRSNGLPWPNGPARGATGAVSQAPGLSKVECTS